MNTIKVFISSNINKELKPIRDELSNLIEKTGFAKAYVYEKSEASSFNNNDAYLFELSCSDVMILLIDKKDEIGRGTQNEIDYAMSKGIKILAIVSNEFSNQISEIENRIIKASCCKYKIVKSRSEIVDAAYSSFISDVANYYIKYKNSTDDEIGANKYFSNSQIIHKNFLPEFKYTNKVLLNVIHGSKITDDEKDGTDYLFSEFLKVLLYKKKFSKTQFDELASLIVVKQNKILKRPIEQRLDAIKQYFLNNISESIKLLQSIDLESKQIPNWFRLDKLIDERNLINWQKPFNLDNDAQKKIDENNEVTFVPVLDRLRSSVEGYISKIYEDKGYESPYSSSFHSLEHIYKDLCSYFCCSLIYGSLTHLLIFRDLLIRLLLALYNNNKELQIFLSLYDLLLKGNKEKELNLFLSKTPEIYFNFLPSNEMWNSFSNISENRYIKQIKLLFIQHNAFYLSPDTLNLCKTFYFDFIKNEVWTDIFFRNNKIINRSFNSLALMLPKNEIVNFINSLLSSENTSLISYALEFLHYLPVSKMIFSDFEKINQNIESILITENKGIIEQNINFLGNYFVNSKTQSKKLLNYLKTNFRNYYDNELIIDLTSDQNLLKTKYFNKISMIKSHLDNNGNILIGADFYNLILFLLKTKKIVLTKQEYKDLIDITFDVIESSSFNYEQKASALVCLILIGTTCTQSLNCYIKKRVIDTNLLLNGNRDNLFDKTSDVSLKFLYNFLNSIIDKTKEDDKFLMQCSLHDGAEYDKISCLEKLYSYLNDDFYLNLNQASRTLYNLAFDFANSNVQDLRYYSVCILFKFLNNDNKNQIKKRIEYIFDSSNTRVKYLIVNEILKLKNYKKSFSSILLRSKCSSNVFVSSLVPTSS